ncbi:hypothetical protein ACCO45_000309 [Purpureocillium lilacinum]|uniref:Uncharacterized protein n=1 Tax=Purpureocillium lilacinum TaxID=33203 RepID=A0ACC4E6J6_PURLI
MATFNLSHFEMARQLWQNVQAVKPGQKVIVTGRDLDVSTVVAVSRGKCQPCLTEDETTLRRIRESVRQLSDYLSKGNTVYGVTTGFGGSADSRTNETSKLQVALLQLTQAGVLLESDKTGSAKSPEYHTETNSHPASWVRATMLVRCNATARGHSAVTMGVLQAILRLLRHDITPIIPLRGTVSASGDLMPLSYIAGAIEGNPDVAVRRYRGSEVCVESASEALARENIPKVIFGPKEALGLVNGTAPSAAVAALIMYDAHHLAVLSQAVTAIAVDALNGNSESFHPFIAQLATVDRSPARGSSLAHQQVTTELNSSADNPLVDIDVGEVYYGVIFQAAVVTAAMEKTRLTLQMLGRLLFAQSTEMIDPNLNNGLPTNLAADDPSTSFTMKGVDISMAAYASELCYLANPVSSHVHTAEMHNQSINSLAFLSARMTKKAVEMVSLMASTCLYIGCQAMDLRAMQVEFLAAAQIALDAVNKRLLTERLGKKGVRRFNEALKEIISTTWREASRLDVADRIKRLGDAALLELLRTVKADSKPSSLLLSFAEPWRHDFESTAMTVYEDVRRNFFASPTTEKYIGIVPRALYRKVRHDLGVPFHQGLVEHPGTEASIVQGNTVRPRKTVGSWISIIYEALLDGRIYEALYDNSYQDAKGLCSDSIGDSFPVSDTGNGFVMNAERCSCNGTSEPAWNGHEVTASKNGHAQIRGKKRKQPGDSTYDGRRLDKRPTHMRGGRLDSEEDTIDTESTD